MEPIHAERFDSGGKHKQECKSVSQHLDTCNCHHSACLMLIMAWWEIPVRALSQALFFFFFWQTPCSTAGQSNALWHARIAVIKHNLEKKKTHTHSIKTIKTHKARCVYVIPWRLRGSLSVSWTCWRTVSTLFFIFSALWNDMKLKRSKNMQSGSRLSWRDVPVVGAQV